MIRLVASQYVRGDTFFWSGVGIMRGFEVAGSAVSVNNFHG